MNNNPNMNNNQNGAVPVPPVPPVASQPVQPVTPNVAPVAPAPVNPEPVQPTPNVAPDSAQFINQGNMGYNETSINDLNVDGGYNKMNVAPSYVNDQQVKDNMDTSKKNTVPISKELKTVIIIALVLLVFIIVMPFLFDILSNLRFH